MAKITNINFNKDIKYEDLIKEQEFDEIYTIGVHRTEEEGSIYSVFPKDPVEQEKLLGVLLHAIDAVKGGDAIDE